MILLDLTIRHFLQETSSKDCNRDVSSLQLSQVRNDYIYQIRGVYFKQRIRYIFGPLSCVFALQAPTQVSTGSGDQESDRSGRDKQTASEGGGEEGEEGEEEVKKKVMETKSWTPASPPKRPFENF